MILKNKKGMMDDLFDFLFTVVMAFFSLLFIYTLLVKGIDDRDLIVKQEVTKVNEVNDALIEGQASYQQGQVVDVVKMKGDIEKIKNPLPQYPKKISQLKGRNQ